MINPWDAKNYRRYGYWDLLRQDRNYDVLYEAWTGGSLKVMLWGGLDYARGRAMEYSEQAEAELAALPAGPAVEALRDAVLYAVGRSR